MQNLEQKGKERKCQKNLQNLKSWDCSELYRNGAR